jgi:phage baseplate assembly protein W
MVTLQEAEANPQEFLGRDIALNLEGDLKISSSDDYQQISFYDNLKQAMQLRLSTAKGTLPLHPDYGSRLHELLGEVPTPDLLSLAKAHTFDALLQEPRIEEITSLKVSYRDSLKNVIDIQIQVKPIKDLNTLNMVYSTFI